MTAHSLQKGVHMVTVQRLAKAGVMDRTPVARALTPLERQGRMRSAPGEDRRERRVTVPTRGQQAWAEGVPLGEQAPAHVVRGIVNLRLTECEVIQYRAFKKIMTAICCSHVRLGSIKLTMPSHVSALASHAV